MLGQVDANHPAVVAPEHEVKQEVGACTYMVYSPSMAKPAP